MAAGAQAKILETTRTLTGDKVGLTVLSRIIGINFVLTLAFCVWIKIKKKKKMWKQLTFYFHSLYFCSNRPIFFLLSQPSVRKAQP